MGVWEATPGRSIYPELLSAAGLSGIHALPLSLVPDATAASLLAGIPIAAAFLAGVLLRLPQLKMVLAALVALAFLQVAMGLLQVAGGSASSFYFGGQGGRPFGTFANPNHFANYLAMALAAYIWLAWTFLGNRRRAWDRTEASHARAVALWSAGALLLVTGILMSRSRGAALAGLPAAMCAFAIAVTEGRRARSWRGGLFMAGAAVVAAVALVGFDFVASRFTEESVSDAASVRSLLAASSFEAAAEFWPWGAGWGTYAGVYPRFQPASIVGIAIYAHQDYAQLLFEGGIFAVLLALAFTGLVASRAVQLVRSARKHGRLRRDEMASALCGVGLLGFLLHSVVEFNMHIPANAIVAALLAGAYLRPLERPESEQASQ
jgi:O-antigen ligase